MNAYSTAQTAYAQSAGPIRTHSGTEYDAFARATRALKAATQGETPDFPALARALHDNRRLWTVMATDVADDANQLPAPLRADILSLADFTLRHTAKVLAKSADAAALIEINTSIMKGLRAQSQRQEQPA